MINYLPGLEAGQKIDLDRFKKTEKINWESFLPFLKTELAKMSQDVNERYGNFLNPEGKIILAGEDAKSDQELVKVQEDTLRGSKSLENWRLDREKNPAEIAEMALALVINKFLGADFIVARASNYDDYNSGVDLVVIDKKTGDVVCGFDDVLGNIGDDGGAKKEVKMTNFRKKGGAKIKYGATIKDGELIRQAAQGIPAFYLSLSQVELGELLTALKTGEPITPAENKIFNKLVASLEEQAALAKDNWALKAKTNLVLEKLHAASRLQVAA